MRPRASVSSDEEVSVERQYFVFRGIDHASLEKLREQQLAAHREYVRRADAVRMRHGGPLLDDAGRVIGTCLVLEADARPQIDAWLTNEPFFRAGLFAIVSIEQWGWTYGR
nr:YciI family protein [Pandoraea sp. LA3]